MRRNIKPKHTKQILKLLDSSRSPILDALVNLDVEVEPGVFCFMNVKVRELISFVIDNEV